MSRENRPRRRDRGSVFRIEIDSWSGKKKEADPDFPRAFLYANHD